MFSQDNSKKESIPHVVNWQIAYAARDLRIKKQATLSCLNSEKDLVLEQLGSFSNSNPIMTKSTNKPNSKEVYLEIVDIC